jgi:signal transduction histidine kinase
MVHHSILLIETNELQQRVRSVQRFFQARPEDDTEEQMQHDLGAIYNVTHGGKWLQILDEHGHFLYRAKAIAPLYPTLSLPQTLPSNGTFFQFRGGAHPADDTVLGFIQPIEVRGHLYTVQTGTSLNSKLAVFSDFRSQMLVLTPVLLLVSIIGGWFMSRHALTDITAISQQAKEISTQRIDWRLPAVDSHDELGDLTRALNQMLDRIEAGYRSVRDFTANAAHELRTPLSLIRAETEITLALPRRPKDYRAALQAIQLDSVRMTTLIDNLLAIARMDAGADDATFIPVDATLAIKQAFDRWSPVATRRSLNLHLSLIPGNTSIETDPASLHRILDILLDNACKYTPPGGTISLSLTANSEVAAFSVSDTGIGIPTIDIPRVFDRFTRGSNSTVQPGSGLGLALAQLLANRLGTTLEIDSAIRQGTCFRFTLPTEQHNPDPA